MSQLAIYLFGSPQIELNHQPVDLRLRKGLALLCFLAVEGGPQQRDRLATLLWPGYRQQDARANLRRTLSVLNQSLPGEWLLTTRHTIALNPEANLWVDLQRLRALSAQTDSVEALTDAAALIRGPFLAGFTLEDAPEFDQWQSQESQYWSQQVNHLLERLVRYHDEQQTWETGIPFAQRWTALDPLNEEAHRQLMVLYTRSGQRSAALEQYRDCANILQAELAVAPEAATTQLHDEIRAGALGEEQSQVLVRIESATTPAPQTVARQPAKVTPLPQQATPFLGREQELAQLHHLLLHEANCRLLTLLGPGGSGKTRLALTAGSALAEHFTDGIFFVPLAGLESATRLESAVATALGFTFYSGDTPRTQLCRYLADKSMLLILDNYEHLLDGADLPVALLAAAPALKVLVTSRERLGIQEEWLLEVKGLPYPQGVGGPQGESLEILEAYAAVALFTERARRSRAGFTLTATDAPHVLRICQLTAGMPLALELAATWARLMTPQEIAQQISADLDFLQSNLRDLPSRHRSLRAVFDHSWRLLTEEEQSVLARLSIFRGGFRMDASHEVAGATLPLLLNLADKSLTTRADDGRFTIHELLRQYAQEQLATQPAEQRATQIRFQDYIARFLASHQTDLISGDQLQVLFELDPEVDNILSAWPFLSPNADYVTVNNAFASLLWYMEIRSQHLEFVGFLGQVISRPEHERAQFAQMTEAGFLMLAAMDLRMASAAQLRLGDVDHARQIAYRSLEIMAPLHGQRLCHRTLGSSNVDISASYACQWAWNLLQLAMLELSSGDYRKAQEHSTAAEQQFQAIGYVLGQSVAQRSLGQVSRSMGAYTQARTHFEDSLNSIATLGNPAAYHASILDNLGRLDLWLGNYPNALQRIQIALNLRRLSQDLSLTAASLRHLGQIHMATGNYDLAEVVFAESLLLLERLGNRLQTASTRYQMGILAFYQGQQRQALNFLQTTLLAFEALNYRQGIALANLRLGAVYLAGDQIVQAAKATEHGAQLCASLRSSWLRGQAQSALGALRHRQGEQAEAVRHFREALVVVRDSDAVPMSLEILVSSLEVLNTNQQIAAVQEIVRLAVERPEATHQTRAQVREYLRQQDGPQGRHEQGKLRPLTSVINEVVKQMDRLFAS
ncbi:MAG: BTAD domain-containing putative transcriptional regulator [Caldilineaceae bacterium]